MLKNGCDLFPFSNLNFPIFFFSGKPCGFLCLGRGGLIELHKQYYDRSSVRRQGSGESSSKVLVGFVLRGSSTRVA